MKNMLEYTGTMKIYEEYFFWRIHLISSTSFGNSKTFQTEGKCNVFDENSGVLKITVPIETIFLHFFRNFYHSIEHFLSNVTLKTE